MTKACGGLHSRHAFSIFWRMTTRRSLIAGMVALPVVGSDALRAQQASPQMSLNPAAGAFQFSFETIDGKPMPLSAYAGRALLIVNTASRCGFTPQYRGLQELWTRYGGKGLTVIGVPSNDFGGQEPGSNAEIAEFCGRDYGVTFPMAGKVSVRGANAHPFYQWAARQRLGQEAVTEPRWNFHKYLIGRDGRLAASYPSGMSPTDPRMFAAIDEALEKPAG